MHFCWNNSHGCFSIQLAWHHWGFATSAAKSVLNSPGNLHGSNVSGQSVSCTAADRLQKQVLENATAVTEHVKSHMLFIGGNELTALNREFAARSGGVKLSFPSRSCPSFACGHGMAVRTVEDQQENLLGSCFCSTTWFSWAFWKQQLTKILRSQHLQHWIRFRFTGWRSRRSVDRRGKQTVQPR